MHHWEGGCSSAQTKESDRISMRETMKASENAEDSPKMDASDITLKSMEEFDCNRGKGEAITWLF